MARIAQRIEKNDVEGETDNPFRIYDMLRATIVVRDKSSMKEAFQLLTAMRPQLNVIRV